MRFDEIIDLFTGSGGFRTFSELLKGLKKAKTTLTYHLEELREEGLAKNSSESSFFRWGKLSKVLLAIVSYALGLVTSSLIVNWIYLNTFFMNYPFFFWFINLFLTLLGLYFSIKALMKRSQKER